MAARFAVRACVVSLALGSAWLAAAPAAAATRPPSPRAYEARLFELVNAERARHGLGRLAPGRCAGGFASEWAQRIARDRKLRHQSVRNVMQACRARRVAENVATAGASPERMFRAWMGSRRHRANILDRRATHLGVAARPARDGTWYGVQVFVGY